MFNLVSFFVRARRFQETQRPSADHAGRQTRQTFLTQSILESIRPTNTSPACVALSGSASDGLIRAPESGLVASRSVNATGANVAYDVRRQRNSLSRSPRCLCRVSTSVGPRPCAHNGRMRRGAQSRCWGISPHVRYPLPPQASHPSPWQAGCMACGEVRLRIDSAAVR
jgi:hypothetical protein